VTVPVRVVFAYDRVELGAVAVAELARPHAAGHAAGVTFHLRPGPTPATVVLDGELDLGAEDLFTAALRRTALETVDGEVTVDAGGLRFIDHRALLNLDRFAGSRNITAVVRTRLTTAARLADLLELPHVRVEITG
jgi:hypothetical protein